MKEFKVMDVTLRDGSYAINFQFSCADVELIGGGLDELGYPLIEIGHGMGISASSYKNGFALHSDEEYLMAAKRSIKNGQFGMFCIPGIAKIQDMEKLAEKGMGFVRVGTNVNEVEKSEAYIRKAKKLGITVMANYMKSYAVDEEYFAEQIKKTESYGADVIYIVDSAGSMLPNDIQRYYNAIQRVSKLPVGFHGHDNLGLALCNSLYALNLGIEYIDASLQGLGRSAGNTATEQLTICAEKMGYHIKVDYKKLLLMSKRLVKPFMKRKGIDPVDTICGISGFHSSYLQQIHKIAGLYGVNPLQLIEEYSKIDKMDMDENKLDEIAGRLPKDLESYRSANFIDYFGNEQNLEAK